MINVYYGGLTRSTKVRKEDKVSIKEFNEAIEEYIRDVKNKGVIVKTKRFRTTKNAKLITIILDKEEIHIVKSYKTYVLLCSKNQCLYTGYISATTTQHILRYFKDYCKFDFQYSDVGKIYNSDEYERTLTGDLIMGYRV